MGSFLERLKGFFGILFIIVNTTLCTLPLFLVALFKWGVPIAGFRAHCDMLLHAIAQTWVALNGFALDFVHGICWEVTGVDGLRKDGWYLVLANHQSWTDIVVLQKIFHGKIPFLKFFLKKELLYVPLLGIAWWALDYPFMKRTPPSVLKKKPHLKGKDIQASFRACERFRRLPVSVMIFAEGTRATKDKRAARKSPYRHLLRPKATGAAIVLSVLGDRLDAVLDTTIVYPDGPPSFWDFLCGRIGRICVHVDPIPVTPELVGNYFEDHRYRIRFHRWINDLWKRKDALIDRILEQKSVPSSSSPRDGRRVSRHDGISAFGIQDLSNLP